MLPPNYMSRIPLSILKLIGEHLRYSSKLLNAYRLFNIVAMSTVVFFIAVGPFKEEKSKRYAEYMESFSGSLHVS